MTLTKHQVLMYKDDDSTIPKHGIFTLKKEWKAYHTLGRLCHNSSLWYGMAIPHHTIPYMHNNFDANLTGIEFTSATTAIIYLLARA